ncbi:MAG: ATP-binding protein [Micavibrio aeruginosavorus]|uniref:ATP-binding protein n=1 Tax=Micavibrio aeruginosavorus TaxID=349221 RepID=A0A2W4ZEU1_9BACT|nr:MAG: ATP-binding protein [Micavibrio aeruginosavorus]
MLIEFRVQNFRSFKDEQVFSMVATPSLAKNDHDTFSTGFKAAPELLNTAAIYGANASGKSNLIKAMRFMCRFVRSSFSESNYGELIEDVTPYLFSKETRSLPSSFEVVFLHHDNIYQYGFSLDAERVHQEWLYVIAKDKERQRTQRLIERNIHDVQKSYINPILKGPKENWKSATRDNALILSTAMGLNAKSLEEPFTWFQRYLRVVGFTHSFGRGYTSNLLKNEHTKKNVLKFVNDFDIPIKDIVVVEKEFSESLLPKDVPTSIKNGIVREMKGKTVGELYSVHETEDGSEIEFSFDEESDGTKKLFDLSGPFLDVLENGYTLVIDELNNSIHPVALKGLLDLFKNKETNPKNAQIIFTSHDTNLMDDLGRDRLWKVDRQGCGFSTLTPFSDIEGRSNEAIERRYLTGRYGGIPSVGEIIEHD